MPDMGYVVDPAWSPNGQLLAFSWRRPSGNFDIYIMDIVNRQLVELTRDARAQRAAELGAGRAAHRFRIHAQWHAADLVHAGGRQLAAATDVSKGRTNRPTGRPSKCPGLRHKFSFRAAERHDECFLEVEVTRKKKQD